MFTFLKKCESHKTELELYNSVFEELKDAYFTKLLPLECEYLYHNFYSAPLNEAYFKAKPMVLLIGQHSADKAAFIHYLLERDYPTMQVNSEHINDRFTIITHGFLEGVIMGDLLVYDSEKQFETLAEFGDAFLNKLECSIVHSKVLENITIVDTPSILPGEKSVNDYDFPGVLGWFAKRADRIMILLDAQNFDISVELLRSTKALEDYHWKIRIILHNADMVNHQMLMKVHGDVMFSIRKLVTTLAKAPRLYVGCFRDRQLHLDCNKQLFEAEEEDLFTDLTSLTYISAQRRFFYLTERAYLAKVHAYIISDLQEEFSSFSRKKTQEDLIKNLRNIYLGIQEKHLVAAKDFPKIEDMQEKLTRCNFQEFKCFCSDLIRTVDNTILSPAFFVNFMRRINQDEMVKAESHEAQPSTSGSGTGSMDADWIIDKDRPDKT